MESVPTPGPLLPRRTVLAGLAGVAGLAAATLEGCGGDAPGRKRRGEGTPRATTFSYGRADAQLADLYLPSRRRAAPVVVLVHGGYWQPEYDRSLMAPLARDLADRGYAAWNIDYRAVGAGGGWPSTFTDVASAVDLLVGIAERRHVDVSRVVTVGHSAGGTLALWAAARRRLPAGVPGAGPRVEPCAVVSQAGVNDLVAAARERLGAGAAEQVMGGPPTSVPEHYRLGSPLARLPIGVPQLLVHGQDDALVPISQSRTYAKAANAAGDPVDLIEVSGADHFSVIDPTHKAWAVVAERLSRLCARR